MTSTVDFFAHLYIFFLKYSLNFSTDQNPSKFTALAVGSGFKNMKNQQRDTVDVLLCKLQEPGGTWNLSSAGTFAYVFSKFPVWLQRTNKIQIQMKTVCNDFIPDNFIPLERLAAVTISEKVDFWVSFPTCQMLTITNILYNKYSRNSSHINENSFVISWPLMLMERRFDKTFLKFQSKRAWRHSPKQLTQIVQLR